MPTHAARGASWWPFCTASCVLIQFVDGNLVSDNSPRTLYCFMLPETMTNATSQAGALTDNLVPALTVPSAAGLEVGQGKENPLKRELVAPRVEITPMWPKALQRNVSQTAHSYLYRYLGLLAAPLLRVSCAGVVALYFKQPMWDTAV